ncbi:MAG: hypothetical protein ACYSTS_00540 [Planctomycetota bacterium]|jgi:hypothetical protein
MAKNKSSSSTSNKKLSALEKELLGHAKKGQPVLLYGKDTLRNGREGLIKDIYFLSGGQYDNCKYTGSEKNINSADDLLKAIEKAHKKEDIKKEARLLLEYNDTFVTYRIEDFDCKSGKDVFEKLSCFECHLFLNPLSCVQGILIQNLNIDNIIKSKKNIVNKLHSIQYFMSDTKEYIQRKGIFFLNNLQCDPEDEKWYKKLAKKIESRKKRDHKSGDWLVVYAYDYTTFPPYFQNQFKLVLLDSKDYKVKEQKEDVSQTAKLKRGEKQEFVPYEELIPFIKKHLEYLRSSKGGNLKGGVLANRIKKDIKQRFEKDYTVNTVKKMISKINTNKF